MTKFHIILFNLTLCKAMAQYFLIIFIFFVTSFYLIFKQFKTYTSSKNLPPFPPGPTSWPLLGNIPHLATKMPHIALRDLSKIHGPLFMLKLGTQKMVVASSPEVAKEILKTHDQIFSARFIPKCVITNREDLNKCSIVWAETSKEGWKFLRTLCKTELFSGKKLDAQSCLREKKISEMIEHVKGKNEVNIGELVFVTVFNMSSNVLMSSDLIQLNEKNEDGGMKVLFREMSEIAVAPNISDFYPILSGLDLQGIRRNSLKMGMKVLAIFEPIIQERRKANTPTSQNDFLDVLLLHKFTDVQIHQMLMDLIAAGTDTSISTVEWTMAELIKNPTCMAKVIEELNREVGADLVKESCLVKLSYLHACIKETLRLHPPAPLLLPRKASETCQVMNYTIPKNAQVYINIWAMGRDPEIWDEPLMFKPERFLNYAVDLIGNDFRYIPFGGGQRICPGLPMARRQVSLFLAALLHSFDWSLPDGKSSQELDMTEKFGITLQIEQPLLLTPKPRN